MEKIKSIIEGIFTEGPLKEPSEDVKLFSAWPEAVGPKIAQRARPVSLIRGRLKVAVASSSWLMTLNFSKEEILHKLKEAAPGARVSDIVFFVGPLPEPAFHEQGPIEPEGEA